MNFGSSVKYVECRGVKLAVNIGGKNLKNVPVTVFINIIMYFVSK